MSVNNDLGSFVRAIRQRGDIRQRDLASRIGYSVSWLQQVEANRHVPPKIALSGIARSLDLSPWEEQYLFMLGGHRTGSAATQMPSTVGYLESLNPHPAAYLNPAWTVRHANHEFMRIFKGLWLFPNLVYWHYVGRRTKDILLNWQSSSDWMVSSLRVSLAASPDNPALVEIVERLMPIRTFQQQWEANVIPADPETRPWEVNDLDNNSAFTLDMRAWTDSRGNILLLGVRQTEPTLDDEQPLLSPDC